MKKFDNCEQRDNGERQSMTNSTPPAERQAEATAWWQREIGDHLPSHAEDFNRQHQLTISTDELIELSAYWNFRAEEVATRADFSGFGITGRDHHERMAAYDRRNAINKLLGERNISRAVARSEERLRSRYGLSIDEWHIYRCGPPHEWRALVDGFVRLVHGESENEQYCGENAQEPDRL